MLEAQFKFKFKFKLTATACPARGQTLRTDPRRTPHSGHSASEVGYPPGYDYYYQYSHHPGTRVRLPGYICTGAGRGRGCSTPKPHTRNRIFRSNCARNAVSYI